MLADMILRRVRARLCRLPIHWHVQIDLCHLSILGSADSSTLGVAAADGR